MASAGLQTRQDLAKLGFFAFLATCVLLVIYVDERFLILPSDPEWTHIQAFRWLLLPHGLAGAVALFSGPLQFSDRLRAARPAFHRATGYVYITAACITAAMGAYIGTHFEPRTIFVEEFFHGGLVLLSTGLALFYILNKNIAAHKLWMMRSYGVSLIFIWGRLPDAIPHYHMSAQVLADVLWSGDVAGMVAPDLILAARDYMRRRARRAAA
jgi:hypothetical protein